MAYTLDFSVVLGSSNTGLTLEAQLVDSSGAPVGAAVSTGFSEIGAGNYLWSGSIPDGFQGGVIFRLLGGGAVQAFTDINPQAGAQLAPDALDNIIIEPGVNMRQAINLIAAALSGVLKQSCPGTVLISGVNNPDTVRITTLTDGTGQRLGVVINPPP